MARQGRPNFFLSLHPYPPMEPDTFEVSKRFTKLPPFYAVIYIRFAFSRFFSKFPALGEERFARSRPSYQSTSLRFETTQRTLERLGMP